jgi:hypothetical protein
MDVIRTEQSRLSSLGVVFFANGLIRALESYRESGTRPSDLSELCDRAIEALNVLHAPAPLTKDASAGVRATAEEIATLAHAFKSRFNPHTAADANDAVEELQKDLASVKRQKTFSPFLKDRIEQVILFFQSVAEEGLANCRRHASGDATEAERIWRHYSTG